jgi:hypothetical protein
MPKTVYGNKTLVSYACLRMVTKIFRIGSENLDLIQAFGGRQMLEIRNKSH